MREYGCLRRSEEGVSSSEAGVTDSCEPPGMVLGAKLHSVRTADVFKCWTITPPPLYFASFGSVLFFETLQLNCVSIHLIDMRYSV